MVGGAPWVSRSCFSQGFFPPCAQFFFEISTSSEPFPVDAFFRAKDFRRPPPGPPVSQMNAFPLKVPLIPLVLLFDTKDSEWGSLLLDGLRCDCLPHERYRAIRPPLYSVLEEFFYFTP